MLRALGPLDSAVTAASSQPSEIASRRRCATSAACTPRRRNSGRVAAPPSQATPSTDLHGPAAGGATVEVGEERMGIGRQEAGPTDLVVGHQRRAMVRFEPGVEHVEPRRSIVVTDAFDAHVGRVLGVGRRRYERKNDRNQHGSNPRRESSQRRCRRPRRQLDHRCQPRSMKYCSIASTSAPDNSDSVTPIARFT